MGETINSSEINCTESFWHQSWDELNLSLRLFTCVSVLYIARPCLPNSIGAKSVSRVFSLSLLFSRRFLNRPDSFFKFQHGSIQVIAIGHFSLHNFFSQY